MSVATEPAVELTATVEEVMSTDFLAVPPTMSAAEGANQLADSRHRHLFVVDGEQHVIGVVSNREILKFLVDSLSDPKDEAESASNDSRPWELGNLIQRKPITAEKITAIAGVAVAMTTYSVSCLPVLDEQQRLVGSVGINELLRHLGRQLDAAPEEEFCLFTPKQEAKKPQTPAFFRKANGALVIPKANVAENVEVLAHCVLGFDQPTGRVLVKFIKEQEAGARKVTIDADNYVIHASDFTSHFDVKTQGAAYDVVKTRLASYLILAPKSGGR